MTATVDHVAEGAAAAVQNGKKPKVDEKVMFAALRKANGTKTRKQMAAILGLEEQNFSQKFNKFRKTLEDTRTKMVEANAKLPEADRKVIPDYILNFESWYKVANARGASGRNPGDRALAAVEELFGSETDNDNVMTEDESEAS